MAKTFKEESRENCTPAPIYANSMESVKVGALQRIADATEIMAGNFIRLQNDRDQYKRWYEHERKSNERMARRIAALQGVITKMKKANLKLLIPIIMVLFSACGPSRYLPCPGSVTKNDDTVPSTILISHKPPAFGHSIDGYCVYKNGLHTGQHLKYWHNRFIEIGPQYTIWQCKRRVK